MADVPGQATPPVADTPTTPTPATPAPAAPVTFASFLAEDGMSLKPGWKDVIPEDIRGRKTWDAISDVTGLLKQFGNLDILRGKQGKGVFVPDDTATPTEKEAFYAALGRPATAADYKVTAPKGSEEVYKQLFPADATKPFLEAFYGLGLNQKQVDGIMGVYAGRMGEQLSASQVSQKAKLEADRGALQKEWGDAYEGRVKLAERVIAENTTPEEQNAIIAAYGNDMRLVRLLAKVGLKFTEAKLPGGEPVGGAMTPVEAKSRAEELIAERARVEKWKDPGKYEQLDREIKRLMASASA